MPVSIKVEKFEGPLDLLLQLIEGEELSISEVSLTKIADQYIEYLEHVAKLDPEELADFLVVAAKLLLLKSRELLPGLIEPEEEGPSLTSQLKMYKIFWQAAQRMELEIKKKHFIHFRDKLPVSIAPRFSPPPSLSTERMRAVFADVLNKITPVVSYPQERLKRTISIEERIEHLKKLISSEAEVRFHEVLKKSKSKTEVVVNFLALLELIKARMVFVKQDQAFGDIVIKKAKVQACVSS